MFDICHEVLHASTSSLHFMRQTYVRNDISNIQLDVQKWQVQKDEVLWSDLAREKLTKEEKS